MKQYETMESVYKEIEKYDKIGIGTGRTVNNLIKNLPKDKVYVPSSLRTLICLKENGLRTESICVQKSLELYIDGADFVDPSNSIIKGGGGAVVAEKILMSMSKKCIILVQENKFIDCFDDKKVSLHILQPSLGYVESVFEKYNIIYQWRKVDTTNAFIISDEGNLIVDIDFNSKFLELSK